MPNKKCAIKSYFKIYGKKEYINTDDPTAF